MSVDPSWSPRLADDVPAMRPDSLPAYSLKRFGRPTMSDSWASVFQAQFVVTLADGAASQIRRPSLAYLRKNLAQISIAGGEERGKVRGPPAWGGDHHAGSQGWGVRRLR